MRYDRYMKMTQVVSSNYVVRAVEAMAAEILRDFPEEPPLFVALLRGAAPFASQLMFAITRQSAEYHPELDYMMVSTYGSRTTAGEPRIITDLAPDTRVDGRTVIVLDDVLDKGITAHFVSQSLHARGAADVQLAVLASKTTQRVHDIQPRYCGFTLEDNWLVGMGMDDAATAHEAYRWLPEIREVTSN